MDNSAIGAGPYPVIPLSTIRIQLSGGRGAGPGRALRHARGDGGAREGGLLRVRPVPQPRGLPGRRDTEAEVGKRSGAIRYANRAACRRYPHRLKCLVGRQDFRRSTSRMTSWRSRAARGTRSRGPSRTGLASPRKLPLRDLQGRGPHARAGPLQDDAAHGDIGAPVRDDQARHGRSHVGDGCRCLQESSFRTVWGSVLLNSF